MGRVFLSYAREDLKRARKVAHALEAAGHEVWWDGRLKGGAEYSREIDEALKAADAVVVLWSKAAVASEWVRDEAAAGKQAGKLVPASVDGREPPLGFRQQHVIALAGRNGLARLVEEVGERVPGGGPLASAPQRGRKRHWIVAAAALLLVALGAAVFFRGQFLPERKVSLAVLPFTDLSPARDKAYFAEGVAEEILSTLAAEPGIRVLGRTSARLVERGADPRDLRRKLGVTHLLEGSARSAGDQLRVNVRLIDTADGRQLWEEEYQGRPRDVFAVQDQIAGAVVKRLRGTLDGARLRPAAPTDPQTFQTYLAARGVMRSRSQQGLNEAMALAKEVIRRDPDYAPGHALLAELYQLLSNDFRAYGTIPLEQTRKLAIPHARTAIRLAPDKAEGYAALGLNLDGEESFAALRRAIELDPSRGELRTWLGFSLNDVGRHDEALAQYRAAVDIDPLGFVTVNRLAHALAAAGEIGEAEQVVSQFIARGGDKALEPTFRMQIANWRADPSSVIVHGRRMLQNERVRHQYFRLFLAAALNALGEGQAAANALLPMQDLHAPYYRGDLPRLRQTIARTDANLWHRAESSFAFVHLAHLADWAALTRLYDRRGSTWDVYCVESPNGIAPFVLALRAQGRAGEAKRALDCLRQRLTLELRNKARLPQDWPGDLEFRRASLAALEGDREGAIRWLERSVGRGWMGQPYSSQILDHRQFDALKSDARMTVLQRRVDGKIAAERREYLARR